jgi:hypothetical protein
MVILKFLNHNSNKANSCLIYFKGSLYAPWGNCRLFVMAHRAIPGLPSAYSCHSSLVKLQAPALLRVL